MDLLIDLRRWQGRDQLPIREIAGRCPSQKFVRVDSIVIFRAFARLKISAVQGTEIHSARRRLFSRPFYGLLRGKFMVFAIWA